MQKKPIRAAVLAAVRQQQAERSDNVLPPPEERARLRKAAGIKQVTAGQILGVSHGTISFWETGRLPVPTNRLPDYLEFLEGCREAIAELKGK